MHFSWYDHKAMSDLTECFVLNWVLFSGSH